MANYTQLKKFLKNAKIVRHPKHRLATFGESHIDYTLVTDVPGRPDRARLRFGQVRAEKPAILTAQTLRERFDGFGETGRRYGDWLISQYGDAIQGLTYQFKNEPVSTRVELAPPEKLLLDLTRQFDADDSCRKALIAGTDKAWELSLMKFILEETVSSFSSNVQELKERGFFDGEARDLSRKNREIQTLLRRARQNRALVPELGRKLNEYGLFADYQDEFFRLVRT